MNEPKYPRKDRYGVPFFWPVAFAFVALAVLGFGVTVGLDIGASRYRAEVEERITRAIWEVKHAYPQIGGEVYSERTSTRPHGHYIIGFNTTGSTINDGTLVMADTSGATASPQIAMGKGFKTWTHVTTFGHAQRVLGVLMGSCAGYSQGRILVLGFHPWVKVDATAITAFSLMRPSLSASTQGAMAAMTAADTTTITTPGAAMRRPIIGIFQRYANVDSLRGYVWVNTLGGISP